MPYQCGSRECGINTVNGIKLHNEGRIGAVYLDNHGPVITFNSGINFDELKQFIDDNVDLD